MVGLEQEQTATGDPEWLTTGCEAPKWKGKKDATSNEVATDYFTFTQGHSQFSGWLPEDGKLDEEWTKNVVQAQTKTEQRNGWPELETPRLTVQRLE